jgi:tellurite resistance protein TehA-like permease
LVSALLPIGCLCQGASGIIELGVEARKAGFVSAELSTVLYGAGVLMGLIMWGYALLWMVFAVVGLAARFPNINFSMAWWGFTFPVGTFALASAQLGLNLRQTFFNVVATVVTVIVIMLWVMVAVLTTIQGWSGKIFYAPCLASVNNHLPEPVTMAQRRTPEPESDKSASSTVSN